MLTMMMMCAKVVKRIVAKFLQIILTQINEIDYSTHKTNKIKTS